MSGFAINQFTVSGNLTRDPELRHTHGGTAVCNLRIANNTSRKDGATGEYVDKPNYFDVTIWKGMGEWVARNLTKGDTVVVSGRIEWREYESNGVKRQAYDVIADSVVVAGSGGRGNGGGATLDDAREAAEVAASASGADEDIPF